MRLHTLAAALVTGLGTALVTALVALSPLPAVAQQSADVLPCDWQARADAIVEPWEANTRTFSNGKTRLALLDTIEPAAGWAWLLVLSPPNDELGGRQCRVVGLNGMGFAGMDFAQLASGYDPSVGLTFAVPVQVMAPDGRMWWQTLSVTLNQATGALWGWVE